MNRDEHDRLLAHLLTGGELESLRHATLKSGLAALRHKRRRYRIAMTCALTALPLLAGLIALFVGHSIPQRGVTVSPARDQWIVLASDPDNPVKVISDEELFALFANRPLALVGKPGHQQLVFLDQPEPGQVSN
jgi:hypothetical protein